MATRSKDRNAQAVAKKQAEALPKTFKAESIGVEFGIRGVSLEWIDRVQRSVEFPEMPTYEVKLLGGRTVEYPLDEKVVEQSPEYKPLWRAYLQQLGDARAEQADRVLRATLVDGTVMPDEWYDAKWARRMRFVGQPLPDDPEEQWVVYLISSLTQDELMDLSRLIFRLSGVSEDMIKESEESFPDTLQDESAEGRDVADAGSDSGADSGK